MTKQSPIPAMRETKPRRRSSRKLLFLLVLFFITLCGVLFFQSSLSEIATIRIEGERLLSEQEVLDASGIETGGQFFGFRPETVERRLELLAPVRDAVVTRTFPGRVDIVLTEHTEVAYQLDAGGKLEVLLANGTALPASDGVAVIDKPILSGWELAEELKVQLCEVLGDIEPEHLADISEIRPDPSDSYPDRLLMYTRSSFEVVSSIGKLEEKLPYLDNVIYEMRQKDISSGRITMLEAITGEPFESEEATEGDAEGNEAE